MASTSWLVEVADVFLTSVLKYGHLWLLRRELVEALMGLDATLHFMPNGVDVSGLFEAALSLLRRFRNVVTETTLRDQGGRRGLVLVSTEVCPIKGSLLLLEGLGEAPLPYGKGVDAETRLANPEIELAQRGPSLFPKMGEVDTPDDRGRRLAGNEAVWGSDRISCRAPRLPTAPSGGGQPRAEDQGNKAGYPVAPVTWERELVAPSVCQLREHLVLRDEGIYHSE